MKSFRRSAARSHVSVICMLLLLVPAIGTALIPTPAAAQVGTQEVAVVDFRNMSNMPNEMFSTMTTDAVVVELLRSGKFSVVKADTLQSKMEELGYREKGQRISNITLSPSMMTRLGSEVGASSVVSGEVTSIKVDKEKKRAEVRVAVRLLDVTSGEYINGAAATGSSYPRIGYTPDKDTDWVIEAINNAASKAVDTMVQYIIPEATIIGASGTDEVLLNKGTRDGIFTGMEMIIVRRGDGGAEEVVGRLKITDASGTDANAKIIKSMRGAQPEDRVRAVYTPPEGGRDSGDQSPRESIEKKSSKGKNLLIGVLVAIGLWAFFKPDSTETVNGVAAAFDKTSEFGGDGGIVILGHKPNNVGTIEEFHIFRGSPNGAPVRVANLSAGFGQQLGRFDYYETDTTLGQAGTYQSADAEGALGDGGDTNATGIVPGETYTYWVSCLYKRNKSTAEGTDVYAETVPKMVGTATYLQPPVGLAPGDAMGTDVSDLSNIEFEWEGSRATKSAVKYVIEVSTDISFTRDHTWVSPVKIINTTTDGQLCTYSFVDILNKSSELRDVANRDETTTLYWRVGARAVADNPGPYPAGPTAMKDGPKNTRYIYSDTLSFITEGGVPDPPGGDDDNGGGDDDGGGPPPPPL